MKYLDHFQLEQDHFFFISCQKISWFSNQKTHLALIFSQNISQTSNIAFLLSSNVGFRFWFNPSEYCHQKGFIPLLRVPSFFEKWQVVIKFLYLLNKYNFKLILQPTVLTTLFQEYSVGLPFWGDKKKTKKVLVRIFPIKKYFCFLLIQSEKTEIAKDL